MTTEKPVRSWLRHLPAALAVALAAATVEYGRRHAWKLPAAAELRGAVEVEEEEWCKEHPVPKVICVECSGLAPKRFGWCKLHGVGECPHCHPEAAELPTTPTVAQAALERVRRALDFDARETNGKSCRLPERRIQLASAELASQLGVECRSARVGRVVEGIEAPGEVVQERTATVRTSALAAGYVAETRVRVGDRVDAGDVLAFVETPELSQAVAEAKQAAVDLELKRATLDNLGSAPGGVSGARVAEAEAALDEARLRAIAGWQTLANFGLPVEPLRDFASAEVSDRLAALESPGASAEPFSVGRLAVRSPIAGVVAEQKAARGDPVGRGQPIFVVVDPTRRWLNLSVRLEDVPRLRPGAPVAFRAADRNAEVRATVKTIGAIADERTRTVSVRAEFDDAQSDVGPGAVGVANVILRDEPQAVLVPAEAVHSDGDCKVVFVRDRRFGAAGAPAIFHVRQIRPGGAAAGNLEVAAGLLPGEYVAVAGSGVLRSELLKHNLGAG